MRDSLWVKIEAMPAYFREGNPLADASDYRAFIDNAVEHLQADALRCYRKHGRGVIVLGRPAGIFVEGWYGVPRSDHPSGLATAYLGDLSQYNPLTELLVGAGDAGDRPARLWRVRTDPATPTAIWRDFELSTK